ncbi:MAG: hypothetical protein K2M55_08855 [Muribaculaceae bacterium]|nr:hypothetical protein [Muribaculaceae bacterium]
MEKATKSRVIVACCALVAFGLSSCVDHDYDLSKDINMEVTVGGNLTLPPSSTAPYTMAQILNLDANSSIKPVGAEYGLNAGDYVLVQDGSASPADFSINPVTLTNLNATASQEELTYTGVGTPMRITSDVVDLVNDLNISDDNVDKQVVSITSAKVDIALNVTLTFSALDNYHGSVYVEPGFEVAFPDSWVVKSTTSDADVSVVSGHILRFNSEKTIPAGQSLNLSVVITDIDLSKAPAGQGIYQLGHFRLNADIVSNGKVSIDNGGLALGESTRMMLDIKPRITTASINGFTGRVNPDVTIDSTSFDITGVPEFLKGDDNNLDLNNPCIYLKVNNTSPVDVDVNAALTGYYDGKAPFTIYIGSQHGTAPVLIKANAYTVICLSRLGQGADTAAGEVNVAVPDLGALISTIPDKISMLDISAKVPQDKDYTLTLGSNFGFTLDYQAVVPLSFGPDMHFVYSTDDNGWDEDLDKYNFNEVHATIKVENTVPMNMVPSVRGIGRDGKVLSDITATVTGTVAAGSLDTPSVSTLEVVLKSTAANIGELDGVEFDFSATAAPAFVGMPLNQAQALRFTEVRLQLVGGIDIDLN